MKIELEKIKQKDILHVSKAISIVENRTEGYYELMDSIYHDNHSAPVIGITGAPGAGKSTFINQLVKKLASQNKSVAVIAVDPSSIFSGGALLGDRIRMDENYPIEQVYIRSIATRGDLGGISRSVNDIAQIFRAANYDYIIVESVGVGQSEIEIRDVSDIVVLLMLEGTGDDIQFIKAGIMEIADLFAINKIDINPPGRILAFLNSSSFLKDHDQVCPTDSISGKGFDEIVNKINKFLLTCKQPLKLSTQNAQNQIQLTKKIIVDDFHSFINSKAGYDSLDKLLQDKSKSPYHIVKNIREKFNNILSEGK